MKIEFPDKYLERFKSIINNQDELFQLHLSGEKNNLKQGQLEHDIEFERERLMHDLIQWYRILKPDETD